MYLGIDFELFGAGVFPVVSGMTKEFPKLWLGRVSGIRPSFPKHQSGRKKSPGKSSRSTL